ncbi:hypothetical protein [Lysobacter enzymogenes]|uniref:hypothetical protein n=1 Tax=Lysobacter enzymogenes TaxID=69 RepID=UPI001F519D7A|nr:hypothetical protein [Lysobacter enzymogenes]UZW62754.1 hypothetical protein BV903_010870 [Lysobacter enzymogenes]
MHRPDACLLLAGALIALLAACNAPVGKQVQTPQVVTTPASVAAQVDAVVEYAQSTVADVVAPVAVEAREVVQAVVPPPVQTLPPQVSPAAVDLIVRWEVTSESRYTRSLLWPVWPGGASGITWGIGYDGGLQTERDIRSAWSAHPAVDRLAATAGLVGERAKVALPQYRDIATSYPLAYGVFADVSLPAYRASARSAFRSTPFDALPADAQGALVSLVYNRGASMTGSRNTEKRTIRDECLPAADVRCIATQLRAMCRLWAGTPNGLGLCNRRKDEARLAEASA